LGEHDVTTTEEVAGHRDYVPEKVIKHPNYTSTSIYHDIVLLKLVLYMSPFNL
jgi:hypothetical protein